MEYTVKELADLAGVSGRTLRYYDQIGLLKPLKVSPAGYRLYGPAQVNLLQQILFYRQRGVELGRIKEILYGENFDTLQALQEHLDALFVEKRRLEGMIATVEETIAEMKGEYQMNDYEKFRCFKEEMVRNNEKQYGAEIREKYGDEAVDESNRRMMNMTEEEYENFESLSETILEKLEQAVSAGESAESQAAREIARLHRQWLLMTWGEKQYSRETHRGLADLYTADERFAGFYDKKIKGCAVFLREAVKRWI